MTCGATAIEVGTTNRPQSATLQFGQIHNVQIISEAPVASLQAESWDDSDARPDVLRAPGIGQVRIAGAMDASVDSDGAIDALLIDGALNGDVAAGGTIQRIQVRGGDLAGDVAAGAIGDIDVLGSVSGDIAVDGPSAR